MIAKRAIRSILICQNAGGLRIAGAKPSRALAKSMGKIVFLKLGIIALMGIAAFSAPVYATPVLTREDINTYSHDPAKLVKLRAAVAALMALPQTNAASWFSMASIHGISPNDSRFGGSPPTIQALWNQCHRDDSLFFLWHRAYVASMEKLMQDAISDPDFRLPYWDWYANPSIPEAFRDEFLDSAHTQRNSLYIQDRNPGVNSGHPVWTPVVETNYSETEFSVFQDQLNFSEHGEIHVGTGKATNMGNPLFAGRDPLFFVHHSNIDRLLEVWLKINVNTHKAPDQFPQWVSSLYRFPLTAGGVYTPTVDQLALNSMQAMGYQYESVDAPQVPSPSVPQQPKPLQAAPALATVTGSHKLQTFASVMGIGSGSSSPAKPIEVSEGGTVTLAVEPTQSAKLLSLMEAEPEKTTPEQAPALIFEDVQLKEIPPGVLSYRVYINLPKEGTSTATFPEHFVGTISLFKLGHMAGDEAHMGHSGGIIRLTLPASVRQAASKKLASDKSAANVVVSLLPVLAPGAVSPKVPVLTIGQIRLEGVAP